MGKEKHRCYKMVSKGWKQCARMVSKRGKQNKANFFDSNNLLLYYILAQYSLSIPPKTENQKALYYQGYTYRNGA